VVRQICSQPGRHRKRYVIEIPVIEVGKLPLDSVDRSPILVNLGQY
jgi:hypothetical protein